MTNLKYKRILLKLSGEALGGADGLGIHPLQAEVIAERVKECLPDGGGGCHCHRRR